MLRKKHQKLVRRCYPIGKQFNKKPNSSELSYLLYYASTRREKLRKIFEYIFKKTQSDVNQNRIGNINVTISIVKKLIEICFENLDAIGTQICNILRCILKMEDIFLIRKIMEIYRTLCMKLNNKQIWGDNEFVMHFIVITRNMIELGIQKQEDENSNEWIYLSIRTCQYVSMCFSNNDKICRIFTKLSITIFNQILHKYVNYETLKTMIECDFTEIKEEESFYKTSMKSCVNFSTFLDDGEFNCNHVIENEKEVFLGLKYIFESTYINQISEGVLTVISINPKDQKWGSVLLEYCTSLVPVHLRFIVLNTLLKKVSPIECQNKSNKNNFETLKLHSNFILSLISSKINMIGLSVTDAIQKIISIQSNLFFFQSEYFEPKQIYELSSIYSQCLSSLVTHIYYFNQIPDSIKEIFSNINNITNILKENQEKGKKNSVHVIENSYKLIVLLLDDIKRVFLTLNSQLTTINRNHVSLDDWKFSFKLLNFISFSNKKKSLFSTIQIENTQLKYLKLFCYFLMIELSNGNPISIEVKNDLTINCIKTLTKNFIMHNFFDEVESLNSESSALLNFTEIPINHLKQDINTYIYNKNNFVSEFLIYLDSFFKSHENINDDTQFLILSILVSLLIILGINFINNFIPFFFQWILSLFELKFVTDIMKIKDTIGFIVIFYSLEVLNRKYPGNFKDISTSSFYQSLKECLKLRLHKKIWKIELSKEINFEKILDTKLLKTVNYKIVFNNHLIKSFLHFIHESKFFHSYISYYSFFENYTQASNKNKNTDSEDDEKSLTFSNFFKKNLISQFFDTSNVLDSKNDFLVSETFMDIKKKITEKNNQLDSTNNNDEFRDCKSFSLTQKIDESNTKQDKKKFTIPKVTDLKKIIENFNQKKKSDLLNLKIKDSFLFESLSQLSIHLDSD